MAGVLLSSEIATPSPIPDLARFDEAPPLAIDEQIFAGNIAALRTIDPVLADAIAAIQPPEGWRAVRALDGFPTYRRDRACGAATPEWRCGTAAPRIRAESLLASYAWHGANPALPELGTGAELVLLLERLPPRGAVFVFVENAVAVGAVLRIINFAGAIRGRRCVLVPPGERAQYLRDLLDAHPGLLAPGQIVRVRGPSAAQIESLRGLCESAAREVTERRGVRLAALARDAAATSRSTGSLRRLALVDFGSDARTLAARAGVTAAAKALGWSVCVCTMDDPTDVHPLSHMQRLAAFAPDLTILMGKAAAAFPRALGGRVWHWWSELDGVPAPLPSDCMALATTPAAKSTLRAAGIADAAVLDFFWAADIDAETEADAVAAGPPGGIGEHVLLLAPPTDARPAAHGIDQPMHRRLWEQTRSAISDNWTAVAATDPERMLATAEKRIGAALRDPEIRAAFLRAVQSALIPATVAERISQALQDDGATVRTTDKGEPRWEFEYPSSVASRERVADSPAPPRRRSPTAVIVPWLRDPLTPELLCAAAAGTPILMFAPDPSAAARALGGVLHPQKHLTLFSSAKELHAGLRDAKCRAGGAAKRAALARGHVRSRHTWTQRLVELSDAFTRAPATAPTCAAGDSSAP